MLNLIDKLATALRGGTREVLEQAVDANALRILAQEIHECETAVRQSKHYLTDIVAQKIRLQRQLEAQQTKQQKLESQIQTALHNQDETHALALAEQLAGQEHWQAQLRQQCEQLLATEQQLTASLKETSFRLEQYRSQLQMAQANERANRAYGKLSRIQSQPISRFYAADETLERIQRKQQAFADQIQAAKEVTAKLEDRLDSQTQQKQHAEAILKRFKAV